MFLKFNFLLQAGLGWGILQHVIDRPALSDAIGANSIAVSSQWKSIGPFKLGTREVIWGADPLEVFGGFEALQDDTDVKFRSSLAPNATITWSRHEAQISQTTDKILLDWSVSYEAIDWQSMQQIYGWSALQYQTWLRGEIINKNSHPLRIALEATNIVEYVFNGKHSFGGDFFGFHRAPHVVELKPGINVVNIRLVRDVRAHGGVVPPVIEASLSIEPLYVDHRIIDHSLVSPEILEDKLPSPYIGITVQNLGKEDVHMFSCNHDEKPSDIDILGDSQIKIVPGQARPLALFVRSEVQTQQLLVRPAFGRICYAKASETHAASSRSLDFIVLFKRRLFNEAHKVTFLHPSGAVSYAILKVPPELKKPSNNTKEISILVGLHGAGVEADSEQVRHAYDKVSDLPAIFLFPTGMSPWSGDDWHTWGLADIMAAVDAIKDWQVAVDLPYMNINTKRVLISGHSNGGQGTWYFATHLPDRTLAAAAASGYTSIENYVPYDLWNIAEQDTILTNARKNFRNELFVENLAGIPVMQQHGSLDDNVPPYHSRLMSSLRAQAYFDSEYFEFRGKPHWWDGVMTTTPLKEFYQRQLHTLERLAVPSSFSVLIPNSADFGSKFGIVVDQLQSPDRLGRITVRVNQVEQRWHVRTTNIHRFHLDLGVISEDGPRFIYLDDEPESRPTANRSFVLSPLGTWIAQEAEWRALSVRSGPQRGALESVLRSGGTFQLVDFSASAPDLLVQTSLNLLQYFGAASDIISSSFYQDAISARGNVIVFAVGQKVPTAPWSEFPVHFTEHGIILKTKTKPNRLIKYSPGLAAVVLRPLADERLELIVWGDDLAGLQQAMRMIPTLTGGGQPDFIILSKKARWLGHGGALALGFFDYEWAISGSSYV